ncbi:MAG: hypothetical protein ABSG79_00380 [Bryobacteraceae bacterium]|jgi:hypothetical protein
MDLTFNLLCSASVVLAASRVLQRVYRRIDGARRVRRGLRIYVSSILEEAA